MSAPWPGRPSPAPAEARRQRHLPVLTSAARSALGTARFVETSCNRNLSPVELVETATRPRPKPKAPFVSATTVSIEGTCPSTCPYKSHGCYEQTGFSGFRAKQFDSPARGFTAEAVIAEEARLIDGAFRRGPVPQDGATGGRDLRIHVGGDVGSEMGATTLAGAAEGWRQRGGGAVWTFTHFWRDVPRESFGSISVLASVELPADIEAARARGFAAAITVDRFPTKKAFKLPGSDASILPCLYETRGTTCVKCRLCLNADTLLQKSVAIGFQLHGPGAASARKALAQVGSRRAP